MSVEARFYVKKVAKVHGGAGEIVLTATTKGDYASWAKATPYGDITLGCLNERATAWFDERLGKDVAITFADPPAED